MIALGMEGPTRNPVTSKCSHRASGWYRAKVNSKAMAELLMAEHTLKLSTCSSGVTCLAVIRWSSIQHLS